MRRAALILAAVACLAAGCTSTSRVGTPSVSTPATAATTSASSSAVPSSSTPAPSPTVRRTTARPTPPRPSTTGPQVAVPAGSGPVIVIDPGHSVTVHGTDPATGLDVSDYENEPEMRDVYAVALLVRAKLLAAGYRVIMTKPSLDTPTTLGRRADIANAAHAALALSIHDQAGSNGGIGFDSGNNTVYYQSVGTYRETPSGTKIYFTNSAVAALSKRYGTIFQQQRSAAQHTSITLLGNTGYNLGGRGLPAGDIWMVQLLSHVPWIYNEAGGNSAGQVGLSAADEATYAAGLVAAVEACVPIR